MQGLIVCWLVSAVALYLTSRIGRGIEVHGLAALLFAAVTIGILNAIVRPIMLLLINLLIGESGRVEVVHVREMIRF